MAGNRIKAIFRAVLLTALVIVTAIISGAGTARAAVAEYTGVIEDLSRDERFNVSEYPEKPKDYGIYVEQIAESADGELFIYTYQPCQRVQPLTATSINMSLTENAAGTKLYTLSLLNAEGTLCKYKVNGVTVGGGVVRYYNVTSIYRAWDKTIDKGTGNDNTVDEVAYRVAKLFTAVTWDGDVKYTVKYPEVVTITDKYVGYVHYSDGVNMGWAVTSGATNAHFVAFSTDRKIDKLMSAKLYFCERDVAAKLCGNPIHLNHKYQSFFDYQYGEEREHEPNPLTVTCKEQGGNVGGGSFIPSNKYTWDRISSTSDFLAAHNNDDYKITADGERSLSDTQWVLSFYETTMTAKVDNAWLPLVSIIALPFVGDVDVKYTEVSKVSVLELEFETDGQAYALGVVDNKQTGGDEPVNEPVEDEQKKVVLIWIIVAVAVVALVVLAIVFPPFGKFLLTLLKGLLKIITLPFTGLWWLFKKIFTKSDGASSSAGKSKGKTSKKPKAAKPTNTTGKTSKPKAGKKSGKK